MFEWFEKFEPEHVFLAQLSGVLTVVAIVFIVVVFVKRFQKIWMDQEKEWFMRTVEPLVGSLVIVKRTRLQWRKEIKQLVGLIGHSAFKRQVVVDHLKHLKNDLSGDSSAIILQLYRDLNLPEHSQRKLASRNWKEQVEGVRELAAMNYYSVNIKFLLARTKNKTLREELVTSMVSLDKEEPFKGLELIDFELTGWMQLVIHQQLTKFKPEELPHFANWFQHNREEVVLYFIALTRAFKQYSSLPALTNLLRCKKSLALEALRTLIGLEEFSYVDDVIGMISDHWTCTDTSLLILHYLKRTTDLGRSFAAIDHYRFHPNPTVKRTAISILEALETRTGSASMLSTLQPF